MRKLLIALTTFFSLLTLSGALIFAQVLEDEDDVTVTAFIGIDNFSTVDVTPVTNEVGLYSDVIVTIKDQFNNGIPGRTVYIYTEEVDGGLQVVQPVTVTDANGVATGQIRSFNVATYTVRAYDQTFGNDIDIVDDATFTTVPVQVPVLDPLPSYTPGSSVELNWSHSGAYPPYEFYVEASLSPDFSAIAGNSGWTDQLTYTFTNLQDDGVYYFRVKARNTANAESGWSNAVFTMLDRTPPVIGNVTITPQPEGNDLNLILDTNITDQSGVDIVKVYCVRSNGTKVECGTITNDGNNYTIFIPDHQLEKDFINELKDQYEFCIEAIDSVGNTVEKCGIIYTVIRDEPDDDDDQGEDQDDVDPGEEPDVSEDPGETPVIPRTPDRNETPVVIGRQNPAEQVSNRLADEIFNFIDKLTKNFSESQLETIALVTLVASVGLGLAALGFNLFELPYIIYHAGISMFSWFFIFKKRRPYGFVYNSFTKEPLSQAIVRIYNDEGKLIATDVTDTYGVFTAALPRGKYKMTVHKRNFGFPSQLVRGSIDYPLDNIYHGELVHLNEEEEVVYSIPVDPDNAPNRLPLARVFKNRGFQFIKTVNTVLYFGGFLISTVLAYRYPTLFNYVIFALYLPSLLVMIRVWFIKSGKYGQVADIVGKKVKGVIVGLRELEFDRLVSTRVTNDDGEYRFLTHSGKYKLEVLNNDYSVKTPEKELLVESNVKGDVVIAKNIAVENRKGEQ